MVKAAVCNCPVTGRYCRERKEEGGRGGKEEGRVLEWGWALVGFGGLGGLVGLKCCRSNGSLSLDET